MAGKSTRRSFNRAPPNVRKRHGGGGSRRPRAGDVIAHGPQRLILLEGAEIPVKQVAEMTGWSESKVKTQAFRARRRMREAVEKLLTRRKEKKSEGER